MTTSPIIEIKGIGKRYTITHQQGGYIALRDIFANILRNPFKFAKHKAKQLVGLAAHEEFWALRDVNLEVERGEVIGIIGKNGSGKSTLLKVLSGITPPTEGEITMRGRTASLLEVGTGFHPELSGRENIFLNGAILGMTKKEIVRKFDEIVAFSGVEKFLDTPVKHYSSGMYVRLAFSVAAHMEPDVLIVDEVLAVGDAEFQKKCMGKMEEVTEKDGRTILFVSHDLDAIQRLCKRTVLLENGKVKMIGETREVIEKYLERVSNLRSIPLRERLDRTGNGLVRLTDFYMEDAKGVVLNTQHIRSNSDITFVFGYECPDISKVSEVDIGFSLHTRDLFTLSVLYSSNTGKIFRDIYSRGEFRFALHELPLTEGDYTVGARIIVNGSEADWPQNEVGSFTISKDHEITKNRPPLLLKGGWEISEKLKFS